jgi:cytidyltransferase-like protein
MRVLVHESLDDLRASDMRFLQEAARLGDVHVRLWSDGLVARRTGKPPAFPQDERLYVAGSLRYVKSAAVTDDPEPPPAGFDLWLALGGEGRPDRRAEARRVGYRFRAVSPADLGGFPLPPDDTAATTGTPKVMVTGCFDWLHSGHVRFFEEVSGLGMLHVVVGSDRNLRLLKGEGHPLFPQEQRRYQVASVRSVARTFISTGEGWLDAEPEFLAIKPDIYAVNEDGDKPEKRAFAERAGIQYVVLRRAPRPGLSARTSTNLRGF